MESFECVKNTEFMINSTKYKGCNDALYLSLMKLKIEPNPIFTIHVKSSITSSPFCCYCCCRTDHLNRIGLPISEFLNRNPLMISKKVREITTTTTTYCKSYIVQNCTIKTFFEFQFDCVIGTAYF